METTVKEERVTATQPEPEDESLISELCVVDLGEHSRKAIKRLRHGEGRLMDKVEDAIVSLRREGIIEGSAQTVVVVVREEALDSGLFNFNDDDDDEDED